MSGLMFVREIHANNTNIQEIRINCIKTFREKGMTVESEINYQDSLLISFRHPNDKLERFLRIDEDKFLLYSGTLIYKGQTGIQALSGIFAHFSEFKLLPDNIKGSYTLLIKHPEETIIAIDDLGLYRLYASNNNRMISTSLLALRKCMQSVTISKQELYEYVLCGTTYGNQTPVKEISTLNHQYIYSFKGKGSSTCKKTKATTSTTDLYVSMSNGLEDCASSLLRTFVELKSAFGNNLSVPITGGFDSRLICACAYKAGIIPDYAFVLHKDHQQDVHIAKLISDRYNWHLTFLDNQFPDWANDESLGILKEQYYKYDGMGVGGAFQFFSGLDVFSRIPQQNLLLDGNGGEIYRNTYRLPNRSMSLKSYAHKTVLNHQSTLNQPRLDKNHFISNLCGKISKQERFGTSVVNRYLLEGLYPKFIQQSWLGTFGSVANQFLDFFAPFLDMQVIKNSLHIPLRYKTMGWFEGELIKLIDPEVAKIITNYGYDFSTGFKTSRRFQEQCAITLSNSVLFKNLKKLIPKTPKRNLPYYAQTGYMSKLRKFEPKLMDLTDSKTVTAQFIDADNLQTAAQLSRLYSVELLAQDAF